MSLLAIDVRNVSTVVGLLDGDVVTHHWRVATPANRTADEWGLVIAGLLTSVGAGEPDGIVVSSTVPSVLHELREALPRHFADVATVILGPGVRTGLPVLMDNPREVGTDRVANAVAAVDLIGGPCVVVDLGFATTFDVVNAAGAYVGGVIAPGVDMSLTALAVGGAQLRQVELERPRSVIARNTIEAMQAGAVYGFAGQVDGIVTRICAELGENSGDIAVVATGAVESAVLEESTTVTRCVPHLTLQGLRIVFDRNRGPH
jgi:type III pantothenate kinase